MSDFERRFVKFCSVLWAIGLVLSLCFDTGIVGWLCGYVSGVGAGVGVWLWVRSPEGRRSR